MRTTGNSKIVFFLLLILSVTYASVVLGATYYMRADGKAENKKVATSCLSAMSVKTHNAESFLPNDIILLCDDGGEYKASIIAPSSGSKGHPITYKNADGDTPIIDLSVDVGGESGWKSLDNGIYRKRGFGRVFWEDDVPLKAASSKSLSDGGWYYPNGSHLLYYRPTSGVPADHAIRTMWFDRDWSPYGIDIRNRSNITVSGITINRSGGGIGHGQNRSSPITPITNIVLHDNTVRKCMWGIWSQVFSNGVESDVRIYDNNIEYCNSGISSWTDSDKKSGHTQHHTRYSITGNKIVNLYSISDTKVWSDALLKSHYYTDHEGISFQDVQDSVIEGNTITTTYSKDMTSDKYWCRAIYLYLTNGDAATFGNSIIRNNISGHFYPSIYISTAKGFKGFMDNIIAYNSIHYALPDKGQISFEVNMASDNPSTGNNYFIHNTIVNNTQGLGIYFYNKMSGNWTVKNNIIKSQRLVSQSMINTVGNLDFSSNIYTTKASWGFLRGTAGLKFSDWKKYGQDTYGSKKVDPSFVSSDNFHLQAKSPAVDAGQSVESVEIDKDIEGLPINGTPDIGAFEFQPVMR